MEKSSHLSIANGKICYIEIPAVDIGESSGFYHKVFGWDIRTRGNGSVAFDDAVAVSGTWVLNRKPATENGLLVSIMVDDITATLDAVTANGGRIIKPVGMDAPEITAWISDPAGNVLGLYQHRH